MEPLNNFNNGLRKIKNILQAKFQIYNEKRTEERIIKEEINNKAKQAVYEEREKQTIKTAIFKEKVRGEKQRDGIKNGKSGIGILNGITNLANNVSKNMEDSNFLITKQTSNKKTKSNYNYEIPDVMGLHTKKTNGGILKF